jgi:hypothetical protein
MTAHSKRIYNSWNWQRLRARKLATVPFCEGGWCRLASSTTWSP